MKIGICNGKNNAELIIKNGYDYIEENLSMLGNMSADGGARVTLGINTYAEEHLDPTAQGGIEVMGEDGKPVEKGGTIRIFWLMLLFCCIAILIFFVSWLLNKRLRKW